MGRLVVVTAAMAASGLFVALPGSPAAADSASGEATGGGTYTVQVSITGSGAGSGGSLPSNRGAVSGGSASVPSPCGYQGVVTQQQIESAYADKQAYQDAMGHPGGPMSWTTENYPVSVPWQQGIFDNWGKQGTWYLAACDGSDWDRYVTFANNNQPVLVGPGGAPPVPQVDPRWLEEVAIAAMTLPTPRVSRNPSAGPAAKTYVNLPGGTWFWVTPRMTQGTTREVTATAGGVSATVVATFHGTTFTSSAGAVPSSVLCPDGGKPYTRGATSSCVLDYQRSSGRGTYLVTAVSRWSATVTSPAGTRAIQGADMPGTANVSVGEIQTINR